WAALTRWIRPRPGLGRRPPAPPAPVAAASAAQAVAWPVAPGLDTVLGLQRAMDKPALYAQMLRRFAQGQAGAMDEVRRALNASDTALAERLVHTLHSVAANIGAQQVADHAHALEQALRHRPDEEAISALVAPLHTSLAPLL